MDNIGEPKKNGEGFSANKKRNNHYHNKNFYNRKKNFKNDKTPKKSESNELEDDLNFSTDTDNDAVSSPNGIRTLPQGNAERLTTNGKPAAKKQNDRPNPPKFNPNKASQTSESAEKKFRPRDGSSPGKTDFHTRRPAADAGISGDKPKTAPQPQTPPNRRKPKKAADIHSVLKTYADLQGGEEAPVKTKFISPDAIIPVEPMIAVPAEEAMPSDAAESAVEKTEIIGIRFKPVGKIYFFDPGDKKFNKNDAVIVETTRGVELGFVAIANRPEPVSNIVQPLKTIVRAADEKDVAHFEENKIRARDTMRTANEKIRARGLKMKLIDAEYTFDNMKLLYYFAADGRVDFRELAKDLAAVFKVRIDLRQVGVRDQPKMMGGMSICGRAFCCNTFLPEFDQVTIKMAKDQNISINSAKISGACGKLMCCLKYEQEMYERESATTPKVHSIVETPDGTGVVIDTNIISGIVRVSMNHSGEGKVIKNVHKSAVKVIGFLKSAEAENDASESEK